VVLRIEMRKVGKTDWNKTCPNVYDVDIGGVPMNQDVLGISLERNSFPQTCKILEKRIYVQMIYVTFVIH
jgi:hypothetical protein